MDPDVAVVVSGVVVAAPQVGQVRIRTWLASLHPEGALDEPPWKTKEPGACVPTMHASTMI